MAVCNPQTFITESACLACLTYRQLQMVKVMLLCQIYNSGQPSVTCSPQDLLNQSPCLGCLTVHQLQLIKTQLACELS